MAGSCRIILVLAAAFLCVDSGGVEQDSSFSSSYPSPPPNLSPRQQEVLSALLESWSRGGGGGWVPSEESFAAFRGFEARQRAALGHLGEGRFILLHMNPGAGLGNRLAALVSGFFLAHATGRALLTDWEAYSDERMHRSRELSTMTSLASFIAPPFPLDAAEALASDAARAAFGHDFSSWGRLSDEDLSAMSAVRDSDLNALLPQRVVVVEAISYFGRLLLLNPVHSPSVTAAFGTNPFPAAASLVLRPSERAASLAGRVYLESFAGRRVVAVHLRTIEYMPPEEVVTALKCAQFLAGGGGIFVASDTQAGMDAAAEVLGGKSGYLFYATVRPGRAGGDALMDGWVNLLLLSRADALVGKARSSYALLASGLSGGAASGRPFYEVGPGGVCRRVQCEMLPGIQHDHPAARLVDEGGCFAKGPAVTVS